MIRIRLISSRLGTKSGLLGRWREKGGCQMQVKPLKINTIRRPGEGAPRHVFKGVLPTRQAQLNLPRSETGKIQARTASLNGQALAEPYQTGSTLCDRAERRQASTIAQISRPPWAFKMVSRPVSMASTKSSTNRKLFSSATRRCRNSCGGWPR